MDEVKAAVEVLKNNGAQDITLLYCNTQYPTPVSDVNLIAMVKMHEETGLSVGYSDHTQVIEIPIAAVALDNNRKTFHVRQKYGRIRP